MRVTMLGTGTSIPVADRVQSGILIQAGDRTVLFDIGSGVLHRLTQTKIPITSIDNVFISHFHVDHCSDLASLRQSLWLSRYKKTLDVYGPGQLSAWSRGLQDDLFPYLRDKIPTRFIPLEGCTTTVMNDVTVRTCPTVHGTMDTLAFRLEHEQKSVFFSSDTAPSDDICRLARGADVMIHECNWLDGEHPVGVHTSPSELAAVVARCAPMTLILTHLGPDVVSQEESAVSIVKGQTDARVLMGRDLYSFEI